MLSGLNLLKLFITSLSTRGKENVIVDALSRRYIMLSQLDHKIFCLESIKELYATDIDFKDAYENCREG
jgi:hypothetical protein